jgi:hypothetical protein
MAGGEAVIIGFGHVQRVGKDTAAEGLCRELGFQRRSFADPLKRLAMLADPLVMHDVRTINTNIGRGHLAWVVKSLGWEKAKVHHEEVRSFLQRLGVGCREVMGEDVWVDMAFRGIKPTDKIVFSDVRFRNEAEKIKSEDGHVVRINRPGHVGRGHSSEVDMLDWEFDEEFDNSGSVADLQANVVAYVRGLLGK